MGKGHYPPIKPHKPVNPDPVNPNPHPQPAGVPLIWWTENADGRLKRDDKGLTDADKANVGIATLIIQRDDGSLWRVKEDKAPYTWIEMATGNGDPYKDYSEDDPEVVNNGIRGWMRVLVSSEKEKTFQIAELNPGDSFEIVDVWRVFDKFNVTVKPPDGMNFQILDLDKANLVLDTIGQGTTWRFFSIYGSIIVQNVP